MMLLFRWNNFLSIGLLYSCTYAMHFEPTPIQVGLQAPTGGISIITSGPFAGILDIRQAGQNNPICGWIDGNGASAVSCGTDYYCATQLSFVGCCSTRTCPGIVTTCFDKLGTDICNAGCQQSVGNLVCGSTLPYCATYRYAGNSVGYGCAAASGFSVNVVLSVTTSDGGPLTIPTQSSSISTLVTSSTAVAIATPTTIPDTNKKDGLGAGAIAGIAIGGVATILIAGIFIFWIISSRRKHREKQLQLQEGYRLSTQATAYGSPSQPSSAPGGGFGYFKTEEPQRSPTLNQELRASAYGPDAGRSPRESYPAGYSGPPIPEMGNGDSRYGRP